jgi:hypothetical protein
MPARPAREPPVPRFDASHVPRLLDKPRHAGCKTRTAKVSTQQATIEKLVAEGAIDQAFVDAHSAPEFPLQPPAEPGSPPLLDVDALAAKLADPDAGAWLYALTVYRRMLCELYDLAVAVNGLGDDALAGGDYARVDMSRLAGRLMPVLAPAPKATKTMGPGTKANFAPFDEAALGGHAFAGKLCVLTVMKDLYDARDKDEGEFRALCVTVTPRAFNRPRVSYSGAKPEWSETVFWVLVLHAYPAPGLDIARLSGRAATEDPAVEAVFQWRAWQEAENERAEEEGRKAVLIGNNRLSVIKQSACDVLRAVVGDKKIRARHRNHGAPLRSASVRGIKQRLDELRADGELAGLLLEQKMSDNGNACEDGLELRLMLLVEHLLGGTPAEGLLAGRGIELPRVQVPLDLHDTLRACADARTAARTAARPEAPVCNN